MVRGHRNLYINVLTIDANGLFQVFIVVAKILSMGILIFGRNIVCMYVCMYVCMNECMYE